MTIFAYIVCDEKDEMVEQLEQLMGYGYDEQFVARRGPIDVSRTLERMEAGDVLIVYQMQYLGLTLIPLFELLSKMLAEGKQFIFLDENIDSRKERGEQFMRDLELLYRMQQRNYNSDVVRTTVYARQPGRPKISEKQARKIIELYQNTEYSIRKIAEEVGVSVGTVHKYVKSKDIF